MKKQPMHKTRVGVFVALGLLACSITIFLLGGEVSIFNKYAYLYADLDQVQGLNPGSLVSLAGLTIGNVESIAFAPEHNNLSVKLRIHLATLARIHHGSVADIRTQGALGDKYIYIAPGDPMAPVHTSGDHLQTAVSSDLLSMLNEKGNQAAKIFDIIGEVDKFLKIVNGDGRSARIVSNLLEATTELKATTTESRKFLADLRTQNTEGVHEAVVRIDSILRKIDKGEGTLGALINDPTLHEKLKSFLGSDGRKQSVQSLIRDTIDHPEK